MATIEDSATKKYRDVDHAQVTSILPDGDVPITDHILASDDAVLVALGYKQEFKREFSLWTTFCVSFAVLGLLPSFASTLYYGMGYAGTGGMVWGWLIAMVFIQCVAMAMAELCSAMPTRYIFNARNIVCKETNLCMLVVEVYIMQQLFSHPRLRPLCSLDHRLVQLDRTSDICSIS